MDAETIKAIGEHLILVALGGVGVHGAHRLHKKSQSSIMRGPDEPGKPWEGLDQKLNELLDGQDRLRVLVSGTRTEVAGIQENVRQLGNRVDGIADRIHYVEVRLQQRTNLD